VITLITGAPGAGKTAACVELLQRFATEGRAIYVDGIPDLSLTHLALDDARKWHEEVPDGSIIVIDEVQRVWRPSSSGASVPPDIAALETHRHKGIEFILMTQHPSLLHANVRRLVGRHVHLRDLGFLGRHWYEWPEASNPEGWKNATIKKRFKLPRKVFKLYKSASLHVKPVRSIPPALVVFVVAVPICLVLAYRAYASVSGSGEKQKAQALEIMGKNSPGVAPTRVSAPAAAAAAAPEPAPAPLVGCIHFGKRCECLDDSGFSVEVELKVCESTSARGGLAVPYDVRGHTHIAKPSRPTRQPGEGSAERAPSRRSRTVQAAT
jgi:zona occludens toxin